MQEEEFEKNYFRRRICPSEDKRRVFVGIYGFKDTFYKNITGKTIFIASVPGAISMLASALYQVIDGILVGHSGENWLLRR